ncbi:hypothetical protein BGW38_007534 [Lunasporangiospora selenospora]|uniref:Homologous recombination OB-fold protein OB-fold domain-containing protein n=1 Tax=Lunasporangiospora selenospora TaxID=979761 RepID=A0A9P6FZ55_9FUNG|nr:hypothetical protein BGW38_007534 [Lunasporangiospora selenospora]
MTPIPPASLRESSTYPRNIVDSGVIQPAQTSSSGSRALFPRELTRPDELDTVDMRHQQRVQREQTTIHDEIGQDEHALQRTRSSSSDIPSAQRSLRKRRLPGPAGNLPRLSAEEKEHLFRSRGVPFGRDSAAGNTEISNPTSSIKRKMKSTVDGPMDSMFANGAWDEMLKVYRLPDYRPSTYSMFKGRASLIEVSLSDIEKRQQQYPGKIRHLVVMIKEFTSTEMDGSVIVLDPSGEMPGTVHRSVLDYFKNNEIRIGTVLVLDNVSVFSPTLVSHYLIITLRNIKGIFQPHPPTILLSQGSSPRSISSQDRLSQRQQHQLGSPSGPGAHPNTGSNAGPHAMTSPSFVSPERIQPAHGMIRRRRSPSPNWPSDLDPSPKSIGGKSNISSHQPTGPNPGNEPQQESQENKSSKASASSKRQKPDSSSVIISPILAKDSQESKDGSEHLSPVTEETLEAPTFQSLRQTFGSSMPLSERNRNSESDMWDMGHLGVTPVIPLGDPTPKLSSQTSILLSSFAAPASIRKRSTSSTTSQRSSSSISAAGSVAAPDTNSRAGPKTTMRGAIPIISKTVNPRGSATETSMTTTTPLPPALMATPGANPAVIPKPRKSLSSELLSSADWLDDISEVDFESGFEETQPLQGYQNGTHNGVSGKDMPSGIYSGHGNGGSRGTGDSRSNARQLPQPVTPASKIENSAATSSAVSTDSVHYPSRGLPPVEEAEDDLDFLLDGLDESELYDI